MENQIDEALQQYFGFDAFRPGQKEVIEHLIADRSAAAVFPTGAGKSLCYQLPALMLPGLTLVVSPLIALMKDQIDALTARNIAARQLDSTLGLDQYREVMASVRNGSLRMLYVAPERFNNERFRESLRDIRISLFAIDEAHCVSEWGHNFRPDYLKLAGFAREFNAERVLALTATATEQVLSDIRRGFDIDAACAVRTGFYRPNLTLLMTPVSAGERDQLLLAKLRERPRGPTIIYVTLQKTAETVAAGLAANGFAARAYHAGLKPDARAALQDWFMQSDDAIVVATIAFGMGVDKADIRSVYHYNLPKSLENYSQEIGRAGRDGETSICHALICQDDLPALENFVYGDTPAQSAINGLVHELFRQNEHFDVNLFELSASHDIRPLVLRTLLTYLELDGYLQAGTPFYADYQFKPLMTSGDILARFEGDQRVFLGTMLKHSKKARSWFHIDPAACARAMGTDRNKVVRALDHLGEEKMLEIKVAGVRHRYQRLKRPADEGILSRDLFERMAGREEAEIHRLQQVVELAAADSCQTAQLAAHFAEKLSKPCGHCSWCLGGKQQLAERPRPAIADDMADQVQQLLASGDDKKGILRDPRTLARFLCGVSSPGIGRARLSRHPLFGALGRHPFKQVLTWTQKQSNG